MLLPKTLSYRKAKAHNNPNTIRRIHHYVNHHMFKICKFLTNENMVTKAVETVMRNEFQISEPELITRFSAFYGKYRSSMMDAINTKRGTSAQLGGKAVMGTCDV